MSDDAKKAAWFQTRQQAWGGFTGLPNRLIDSPPFGKLKNAADVKVLVWFWQEARYEQSGKKKPGKSSPIGRVDKIINNGEISFTYQQAGWRGLSSYRFAKALRQLFRYGFIDIPRQGRGVKGVYTKYAISTRWQQYGAAYGQEIPYPENFKEGFRSDEYKAKQRKRRRKNSVSTLTLPALADSRYEGAEMPDNVSTLTLKTPVPPDSQRESTHVSKDIAMSLETSTPTGTVKKGKKRTRTPDPRSESIAAPSKTKSRPAAIPTWPDQGKVLDLCDGLLLDALDRFGDDGQLHPEMDRARNLTKIINRAVGSRVTN